MLIDIVGAEPLNEYHLRLRFEDGTEGVIDIATLVSFTGVFGPLKNPKEFAAVQVNEELGTVCWPCGADLDPDVLYSLMTGQTLPHWTVPGTDENRISQQLRPRLEEDQGPDGAR